MRAHRNDGAAADAELAAAAAAVAAIRRRWRPERAATERSHGDIETGAASSDDCSDYWSERFSFLSSPGLHSGSSLLPGELTALDEIRWAAAAPPPRGAAAADSRGCNSVGQQTTHPTAHWYGAMAPLDSNVFDANHTVQCGGGVVDDILGLGGNFVGAGFLRRARRAPLPSAFESQLPQQRLLVTSGGALSSMQPDVAIPLTVPMCESPCYDTDASGNASLVPTTVLRLRVSAGDCCCYLTSGAGGGGRWSVGDGGGYDWFESGVSIRCSTNETVGTAVPTTAAALPIPCPQSALYTPRDAAAAPWQAQADGALFW